MHATRCTEKRKRRRAARGLRFATRRFARAALRDALPPQTGPVKTIAWLESLMERRADARHPRHGGRPPRRPVRAAVLLLLSAMAAACGTAPQPAPPPRTAAPQSVPAEVMAELSRLARREGVPADGRVMLQEMELAPNGPRVLLASGTRELCEQDNCPFGLFADEGGTYRPLLLAMGSTPPRPHVLGRLGYPDVSLLAIDSARELRLTRFQWDGRHYRGASCRLVSRMTEASRACVPTRPEDVPIVAGPPLRYCDGMNHMIDRDVPRTAGQTALPDAFEIRGEPAAHVEGLRVAGNASERELEALVQCLRAGGAPLVRQKPRLGESLASTGWTAQGVRSRGGPVAVALTSTFVPSGDYTLLSLGVFDPAAAP